VTDPKAQFHERQRSQPNERFCQDQVMITNDRQRRITEFALRRFERAIGAHGRGHPSADVHPTIYRAIGDALRSEADALRGQLHAYELRRHGRRVPGYIDEGDAEPSDDEDV
jgi:hypothetical protein